MLHTRKPLLRKLSNHTKKCFDPKCQNMSRTNKMFNGHHLFNNYKNFTVVEFKSQCTISDSIYVNIVLTYLFAIFLRLSCISEPSNFELWVHCACLSWHCHTWARGWDTTNSEREECVLKRQLKCEGRYLSFHWVWHRGGPKLGHSE